MARIGFAIAPPIGGRDDDPVTSRFHCPPTWLGSFGIVSESRPAVGAASLDFLCASPHFAITVRTGTSVRPEEVSEYSTRSHLFSEVRRITMRSSSSSRNCSVSTFLVASGTRRRNSPNRSVLCFSALTMIGFHLPSITSMVALTGHSDNRISKLQLQNCAYWTPHSVRANHGLYEE